MLLQRRYLVAQSCPTLCYPIARLLFPWGFFRQEYWSALPFPSPEDLPNSGIEPRSPALQADSLPSEPSGKPTSKDITNKMKIQSI